MDNSLESGSLSNQATFSWDIHYKCNYRCPYCWFDGRWRELAKRNRYLTVGEWMKSWRNIYSRYGSAKIEIVGGEPFIYPDFTELIRQLSGIHSIMITTNLSADIKDFIERVDGRRVKIIPTFHPLFADLETFAGKAALLKERGFSDTVLYLAYPPQINQISYYREYFSRKGVSFSVMTFWGEHEGISYPAGYTQEEREMVGASLGRRHDEEFQLAPKEMVKGKLCRAGQNYAVIQADGTAIRCGGSWLNETIGNFFDADFKLLESPMPCRAEYCKCNEWASLLIKEDTSSCADIRENIDLGAPEDKDMGGRDGPAPFIRNREKNIQETRERKIILESKPLRLGIIPTDWCNLRCIMCPTSRHKKNFTLSASLLSKIEELLPYLEVINWQGGEFFPLKHVREMFSDIRRYPHIENEIITNGLLLDEGWIRLLLESNVKVTFSIDSPVKETYEYIRRGASFDELIKRLKLIMELERRYNTRLKRSITVVVMKSNHRHLTEFVDFVKEYRFENIFFNPVMHIDTEENFLKDPAFDYGLLDETRDIIKEKLKEWDKNLYFVWNLPGARKENSIKREPPAQKNCSGLFCTLPWKSIWISADRGGAVTPDCWCHMSAGNISESGLLEIWNGEAMQNYRRKISVNDASVCNEACVSGYTSVMNPKAF